MPVIEKENRQENKKHSNNNITFSINRAYLLFCMVTLYSLLKNNQKHNFNIYILHNHCLKEEEINNIITQYPLKQFHNFKIHLVDVSYLAELNTLQELKNMRHWTKEIYFKVFLPELVPQVDQILHLDVDVMVRGNITALLESNMGNNLFLGEKDIKGYDNSVCVGVMLLNLEQMRKENITQQLLKIMQEEGIHEQDAINRFSNRILITKPNEIYMIAKEIKDLKNVKIVHYTIPKPWSLIQARAVKQGKRKYISEYYEILKEFIDNKYQLRFKVLTLYALSVAPVVNSYERKTKKLLAKKLKKLEISIKENFLTRKIYKYSIIKKK